ncbi:formyltransferase family protein [Kiloniella litopenaei]|uniref:formyltransferase family protein n=1 Tax=Kiloniella litopenaei TaxID=1549748 RepID=UPI003BA98BBA
MLKNSVLFLGREGDSYSLRITKILEENFEHVLIKYGSGHGTALDSVFDDWSGDYIFSFRCHHILTQRQISKAKIGAINFHPGPPEYRGIGCVNWALFDKANEYGSTAHLISPKIDAGRILDVRRFNVSDEDTVKGVLLKAYEENVRQVHDIVEHIARGRTVDALADTCRDQWQGECRTMRELDDLYHISLDIDEELLERIIRATTYNEWAPHITLHGRKFKLVQD